MFDRNKLRDLFQWIRLLIAAACVTLAPDQVTGAGAAPFSRPEADEIRAELNQILIKPEFKPKRSLLQWIAGKLSEWERPELDLNPALLEILKWLFLVWCVMTLIVLCGHIAWSLLIMVRPGQKSLPPPYSLDKIEKKTYDELLRMSQELAATSCPREAIGFLALALFKYLDTKGLIEFHTSKTNGDYSREFPAGHSARASLHRFIHFFDDAVYSGKTITITDYNNMHQLFERIQAYVHSNQ